MVEREIWVSCNRMTVWVKVRGHGWGDKAKIIDGAPIIRGFMGQGIRNLLLWMENKFGGLRVVHLSKEDVVRKRRAL